METQFNAKYSNALDEMHNLIEENVNGKMLVFYSAYIIDDNELPVNNLNEVAIVGSGRFVAEYNDFYADEGTDYISDLITNPTWLDVAILANDMIKTTGDNTHIYLEAVHDMNDGTFTFCMGS